MLAAKISTAYIVIGATYFPTPTNCRTDHKVFLNFRTHRKVKIVSDHAKTISDMQHNADRKSTQSFKSQARNRMQYTLGVIVGQLQKSQPELLGLLCSVVYLVRFG